MLGIKLLVCPHDGNKIFGVGQIDDVVRIAGQHMHGLYLFAAYFKAQHLVRADLSFFNESVSRYYNEKFPL